jgi:hypothetical protein
VSDDPTPEQDTPLIDVSPALHIAGHEAELLGVEDVEDTAPALARDDDSTVDPVHHLGSDIATRGAGHAD